MQNNEKTALFLVHNRVEDNHTKKVQTLFV